MFVCSAAGLVMCGAKKKKGVKRRECARYKNQEQEQNGHFGLQVKCTGGGQCPADITGTKGERKRERERAQ